MMWGGIVKLCMASGLLILLPRAARDSLLPWVHRCSEQVGTRAVVQVSAVREVLTAMPPHDERRKAEIPDRADRKPAPAEQPARKTTPDEDKEVPAGEDITGEGSPGLTISGGGGHA
jgi:hypothetical protein